MKEKFGIVFIIAVALLCLFGCNKDNGLEENDMVFNHVLCPASIQSENLSSVINRHV